MCSDELEGMRKMHAGGTVLSVGEGRLESDLMLNSFFNPRNDGTSMLHTLREANFLETIVPAMGRPCGHEEEESDIDLMWFNSDVPAIQLQDLSLALQTNETPSSEYGEGRINVAQSH